jgi:predicted phosphoribosyltransferase
MVFLDRHDAGRQLAAELGSLARERPVIVALPRGGVPVAFEVARALDAQLDVFAVRDGQPSISVNGRTVVVVDDGLATGLIGLAAVHALRKRGARQIVVAGPVGSSEAVSMLAGEADRVLCLRVPSRLLGVGAWYRDFTPVPDERVAALLAEAGKRKSNAAAIEEFELNTRSSGRSRATARLSARHALPPLRRGDRGVRADGCAHRRTGTRYFKGRRARR